MRPCQFRTMIACPDYLISILENKLLKSKNYEK